MKKSKKLTVLMVIVVLAAVIFCVKSIKNSSKQTLTITDPDGITYLAVLDQNSNVYAGVTDIAGNLYGARIDTDGYPVLDESLYVIGEYDGTLPKNNTTAVNIQQTKNNETYNYNAAVSIIDETDPPQTTTGTNNTNGNTDSGGSESTDSTATVGNSESTTAQEQKEYLADKYRTLFSSGTYQMTFTSDDPDLPSEITMAFKNGNIYVETTVEGMAAQVIYNDSLKQGIMVLPSIRTYCTLPEDMMQEMSSSAINIEGGAEFSKVKSYKVDINGRECLCESYTYDSGNTDNYYFYNNELVRLDFIEADGSSTVYNITQLSSDVPDSYFEMPKGYLKLNLASVLENYDEE